MLKARYKISENVLHVWHVTSVMSHNLCDVPVIKFWLNITIFWTLWKVRVRIQRQTKIWIQTDSFSLFCKICIKREFWRLFYLNFYFYWANIGSINPRIWFFSNLFFSSERYIEYVECDTYSCFIRPSDGWSFSGQSFFNYFELR